MASGAAVANTAAQLFFCHKCQENVTINPNSNAAILCPSCNDGFIEQVDNPNPIPDPNNPFAEQIGNELNPRVRSRPPTRNNPGPHPFIGNSVRNVRARRPSGTHFYFSLGDEGEPSNFDDFFESQEFDELVEFFNAFDSALDRPPSASRTAIEGLADVVVDQDLLISEMTDCVVCLERFEKDMILKQMPCRHLFHTQCLLPWLERQNSCPTCRYQLPTTDDQGHGNSASGNANSGGGGNTSTVNVTHSIVNRYRTRRTRTRDETNIAGGSSSVGGSRFGGQQRMDTA